MDNPNEEDKSLNQLHRSGPITRNPFLNFLRCLRKEHGNKNICDIAKLAGQRWRQMSDEEKAPYTCMASKAPIIKRCSRKRRRSRSMSSRSSVSDCGGKKRKRRSSRGCGSKRRKNHKRSKSGKSKSCRQRSRKSRCGSKKKRSSKSKCGGKRRPKKSRRKARKC